MMHDHDKRIGIGLFLAAILLGLCVPMSSPWEDSLSHALEAKQKEIKTLDKQLTQWRENAAQARALAAALEGDPLTHYLTPPDRPTSMAQMETLAHHHGVSEFLYTLDPAQSWNGEPAFPGAEGLAQSHLTLEGTVRSDAALYAFLNDLVTLGGRMDLLALKIHKIQGSRHLGFRVDLLWLTSANPPPIPASTMPTKTEAP